MDRPVPNGFVDIGDWILFHIYHQPNDKHSTQLLLQNLSSVLKAEPSQLGEVNKSRGVSGAPAMSATEYESARSPDFGVVQRAVETLVKDGWVKGKRDKDASGVFFSGLILTANGEREAIRRAIDKEEKAKRSHSESRMRELVSRLQEEDRRGS